LRLSTHNSPSGQCQVIRDTSAAREMLFLTVSAYSFFL
jgi:hypothetical protein